MAWTLDKEGADFTKWKTLNKTEQTNWDTFQNAVANDHVHPAEAAARVGKVAHKDRADYKCLSGDQYQIRLSGSSRATFRVIQSAKDKTSGTVKVLQVGGHT